MDSLTDSEVLRSSASVPDVAADPDCVANADKELDEAEPDVTEMRGIIELPPKFPKPSLAFVKVLTPISEPPVFDGVNDGEGLEIELIETEGMAVSLARTRVGEDDPELDENIPCSKISSSSPMLFDVDEELVIVDVSTAESDVIVCEMVDDG